MVAEICEQLQVPQLVFTVERWVSDVCENEETTVCVIPENPDESFSKAMARHCDLLMAFGGGETAAEIVRLAIFRHQKKVVLVSPYAALGLTDSTRQQSVERVIARVQETPSSREGTVLEEISRIVDLIVSRYVVLQRSKNKYGLTAETENKFALPLIDEDSVTGVFRNQEGDTVVRWLGGLNPSLPPNSQVICQISDDKVLCERIFSKARLVPLEGLSSVIGELDGVLPLGAVGYSSINEEREPLLGVTQSQYENFVSLVMQVIATEVTKRLAAFNVRIGFVFGATDGGVYRGVFDAAINLQCPILGIVAQKYLYYAVDDDVTIIYTPNDGDYPKNFMALLTGGAVLPLGGAAHSFGEDLFRWLSQDGDVFLIINTLLSLYTNQVSPAMYKGGVLNAPHLFTSSCHLVSEEVSFSKLPGALEDIITQVLWKLNPAHELTMLGAVSERKVRVKV